ncbi:putative mRNA 3-end processing factor [Sphingobium subterraneum]|uniref:Putative mRNA 3-end processing factor n=2 Tax=Sphingobium subterraneum TaxID=627688 RepID=A0A841J0L2_9SPHN|nr:putative mRNA 3-end processing factor [Sphingobium subterraneum]
MPNMVTPGSWIKPFPQGIYVEPGDFWIDPSAPVDRALVTHGHADHARSGHKAVMATSGTLAIMAVRYGEAGVTQVADYGTQQRVGDVDVRFVPAGHVLGSAQIVLEHQGERVVVSGDYKRRPDPTCAPFEPVPCDIFVTEATFGLPVFRHPDTVDEIAKALATLADNPDRCVLIGAYALGKAQRVIMELRAAGHDAPIYLHGAMQKLCDLYREFGCDLGDLRPVTAQNKADLRGAIILCPPSALNDRWARALPDPVTAMASGWMRIRQRARQRNVELPLILSDHADWDELTQTIRQVDPGEVWITHGREDALLRWCALHQRRARALDLVGREDEDD